MFIDIDCAQEKKYNQNTYGDYFLSKRYPDMGTLIAVLSDGLGSGIKANILATMTATMLLKFVEAGADIKTACEVIMNSLPVCRVRKISYSTFSVAHCSEDGEVKIVEEGNPNFIYISDGRVIEPEYKVIDSDTFKNRHMHVYKIKLKLGDRLIFCSDGVTQAGLGNPELKLGLRRSGLIRFLLEKIKDKPDISSSELAKFVVRVAVNTEVDRKPKDDTSCCVIYYREPRRALIFTGPPYHQEKDNEYANEFYNSKAKKAICGGTTANLISRELNIPVRCDIARSVGKLPAVSQMEGVDLVTEGILTLTRTVEYLENGFHDKEKNAAYELMQFLLSSDCIEFMVGAKLNQAHYDPNLPIEIEIRKNIVKKMAKILEDKYIKRVTLRYI
ncbi:TPA: SpoIIE family protein phosphatase [Candidatus Galligastranaerophilus faecipullorum]|nr:SpoIIE family protein phosphatase [Candidatus Galligastranaerophilus faecipullorum]